MVGCVFRTLPSETFRKTVADSCILLKASRACYIAGSPEPAEPPLAGAIAKFILTSLARPEEGVLAIVDIIRRLKFSATQAHSLAVEHTAARDVPWCQDAVSDCRACACSACLGGSRSWLTDLLSILYLWQVDLVVSSLVSMY